MLERKIYMFPLTRMKQSSTIDISYHWLVPYASNSSISICPVLAQSLQSEDTVYSADSIEFSPVQQDVFVCGTYQIQKVEENKVVEEAQTTSEPNEESGEASDEDDMSDAGANPAPKTTRLGRALVYRVADDGQSLYVVLQYSREQLHQKKHDDANPTSTGRVVKRFSGSMVQRF
jgi:hypothetical protein